MGNMGSGKTKDRLDRWTDEYIHKIIMEIYSIHHACMGLASVTATAAGAPVSYQQRLTIGRSLVPFRHGTPNLRLRKYPKKTDLIGCVVGTRLADDGLCWVRYDVNLR